MIKEFKKFILFSFAIISTLPVAAQDLLARQAPIDRKMKAVDSLALKRLSFTENYDSPAEDLYEDWNNKYAHREQPKTSTRTGTTSTHTVKRCCPTRSVSRCRTSACLPTVVF